MEPGPDPALDPELALSHLHAAPGSPVTVTATVRNVGREPAAAPTVALYEGTPATGTLLARTAVPASLEFNTSQQVSFRVVAGIG
jgi:hypothetical protein